VQPDQETLDDVACHELEVAERRQLCRVEPIGTAGIAGRGSELDLPGSAVHIHQHCSGVLLRGIAPLAAPTGAR
jgi:hypothetical protein